jgi:hypothetical protein
MILPEYPSNDPSRNKNEQCDHDILNEKNRPDNYIRQFMKEGEYIAHQHSIRIFAKISGRKFQWRFPDLVTGYKKERPRLSMKPSYCWNYK